MELDGSQFLILVREDQDKAYRLLVHTYGDRVYNSCLRFTFNEEDAQDLTQEVFTAIFLSLHQFKGNSKLSTWIYSITTNKAKEFIRYKMRFKRNSNQTVSIEWIGELASVDAGGSESPADILIRKEQIALLFEAIKSLPENQRIAYTLSKLEDLSYQEISVSMSVSVSSVESLLFRAKQNLKCYLENKFDV